MKAICLTRLGRKAEAEKSRAEVEAFFSTLPPPLAEPGRLHLEGRVALARGDHETACRALEKAAALTPVDGLQMDGDAVEIRYALARTALAVGEVEKARQALVEVVHAGPARVMTPVPYVRSLALPRVARGEGRAGGRRAEALRALRRYWKRRPDRPRGGRPRRPAAGRASGRGPRPDRRPHDPRGGRLALAARGAAPGRAAVAPACGVLRYDLRPGDHLVYRQRLERGRGPPPPTRGRRRSGRATSWRSPSEAARGGSAFSATARTPRSCATARTAATGWRRSGPRSPRRRRSAGRPSPRRAGSRPRGRRLLPWAAAREATSERLPFFHEIEPLPADAIAPGGAFASAGLLGLPMKAVAFEDGRHRRVPAPRGRGGRPLGAPLALPVERRARPPRVRGGVRRPRRGRGRGAVPARARLALAGRGPRRVAGRAEDRARALHPALAATDRLEVPAGRFTRCSTGRGRTSSGSSSPWPGVIVCRRRPRKRCAASRRAPPRRVQALAARFLPRPPRLPRPRRRRPRRALRRQLPAWAGPIEPAGAALLAQRAPGQVPGTTLRFMRAERFRGRPTSCHVPDDYRGDEPFPLVVLLGGGPGRAVPTAQTARSSLEPLGVLALFPQAHGMWWEDEPGAAVEALLKEALAELNVDTDRVTLTGFSNGGTGSVLYASRMPHRFAAVASLMGGCRCSITTGRSTRRRSPASRSSSSTGPATSSFRPRRA